ncbi:ethanolamine ammonia-lyase light chain EutC, partial [Xanthomonas perforans]
MSAPSTPPRDAWAHLRQLTPARIALGRVGTSLPTDAHLEFQLAHAQARDAVHLAFDPAPLQAALEQRGRSSILLQSAATDRHQYLQRPDLGRRLAEDAAAQLRGLTAVHGGGQDVAVVIADGLSALAVHRHAARMLDQIDA